MADEARASTALDALGHPTRRRVLELLRGGAAPPSPGSRASCRSASRPYRSTCESSPAPALVDSRPSGTRRYYRVAPDGLVTVRAYLDTFWDGVLDAFTAYAEENP